MATTPTGLPSPFSDNTTIPGWQRRLHFYSELAAIAVLPKLFAAASDAGPKHKGFLTFLAWSTLVVDGYLVYRWVCDKNLKSDKQKAASAAAGSRYRICQPFRSAPPRAES